MTFQLQVAKEHDDRAAEKVACVMAQVETDLLRLAALKNSFQGLELTDPGRMTIERRIQILAERIQTNKTKAASLW